jgi:leucine dehydrogenase
VFRLDRRNLLAARGGVTQGDLMSSSQLISQQRSHDGLTLETEHLTIARDRPTGLVAIIAIDDTTLGPALGGIRWTAYPSEEAAILEARRLGQAMTLKNALAGIGFGGGKAVIVDSAAITDRREALLAFGRLVADLGGKYVPAADMGTSVDDLRIVGETAGDVSCDEDDPSISTAAGVHAAIAAAVMVTGVAPSLGDVRVVVQGAGHVGARLAALLAAEGARVLVADADLQRALAVAAEVGGRAIPADEALTTECEVFAPCAVARVLTGYSVPRLSARIVAGAANDVLADSSVADALLKRDIAYVPDFVASAGGVIQVRALRDGWSTDRLDDALTQIGGRTISYLEDAKRSGRSPLIVAHAAAVAALGREPLTGADMPQLSEVTR